MSLRRLQSGHSIATVMLSPELAAFLEQSWIAAGTFGPVELLNHMINDGTLETLYREIIFPSGNYNNGPKGSLDLDDDIPF